MLDNETKRRIDSARDILVGKIPDPKAQVEQITTALIYKFMDDMDSDSVELGGKSRFFTGAFERFSWAKLMDARLGGADRLSLYVDAITRMSQNPNLPQLFRDIFKDAFLPYRDPETLNLFLKEINGFSYDHSERLGDAFEYLLSVLGSQGAAGQFRTPRHIIDFIVDIAAPQKDETLLDPACGTAGFLISSYKHILNQNGKDQPGDRLTPDEKAKLMAHFTGYDISPDMTRLSRVNMYLHGFPNPKIYEYDTLTSEDRWDENYDVILANPPFMTPKGGIRPHKRFSVRANRSEVLFVDYIAEHLNASGRAGVIVPEGIIFQSGNAYKQLRKMLVDEGFLWAVVSLPAGVFNPYSGVKTSILLMDKTLAKRAKDILFVKIQNDGFDLGAQRREIDKNDLPLALEIITEYQKCIMAGTKFNVGAGLVPARIKGQPQGLPLQLFHLVPKEKIASSGDYNFSGDRYKEIISHGKQKWPMVELGEVCEILDSKRKPVTKADRKQGKYPYYGATGIVDYVNDYIFDEKLVLIGEDGAKWGAGEKTAFIAEGKYWVNNHAHVLRPKREKALDNFIVPVINSMDLTPYITGVTVPKLNQEKLRSIKIPLPPLEVQKELVAEIDGYQKIIDGARQVVGNWKPKIEIEPSWGFIELGKAKIEIIDGDRGVNYPQKEEFSPSGYCLFLNTKNVRENGFNFKALDFIPKERDSRLKKGKIQRNDLVLTTRGTVGNIAVYDETVPFEHIRINSGMVILRPDTNTFLPEFVFFLIQTDYIKHQFKSIYSGSAQPQLPIRSLVGLKIPVPPLSTQKRVVAQIEEEQKLIAANKKLIEIYEQKIKDKIAEVWGG